tara:strand:- start:650 stop:796 length:147 start_codon:yes stop_codon:yes gene_type:complete
MEEKKLLNSINESRSESSLPLKNIPIEILDLVTEIINEINWNEKKINS